MSTGVPVTPERIMQFTWGYVPTLILEAAIHHRVFDKTLMPLILIFG
jgi:hypothetical protein